METGKITASELVGALELQRTIDAPLGEILVAKGSISRTDIRRALADQHSVYEVDLITEPPDPDLAQLAQSQIWMKHVCVPWMRLGNALLVATARPDQIQALTADLPEDFPTLIPVVADMQQIQNAISSLFKLAMIDAAERRVGTEFSCREWEPLNSWASGLIFAALGVLSVACVFAPGTTFLMICAVAICCMFTITLLKLAALIAQIGHRLHVDPPAPVIPAGRWPKISVIVPLYKETEIAAALVDRLQRIAYPHALLDVVLVLEENDTLTKTALQECTVPHWMRIVEVPTGCGLTTKPRAMNYALDFCDGEIVGIWDAEDAPDPNQLRHVAARFAQAPPDVVCLQGILDYYNPRANWIARCFTLEYGGWFRVVLPGLARLGLVIPLGGTTVFLKRDKIVEMGGWDAHNVTEDADLGVRIARFGYRTEFISSPTHEEANCRPWRWVKQRSRWLKGFMLTYAVHMRHPLRLLSDLGWARFLGVQAFFIGSISQFLFAPFLWTFWLGVLTGWHPTQASLDDTAFSIIMILFVVSELINLLVASCATLRPELRFLLPWVVTLPFYFPLGALAGYKALYELVAKPFYWDKTQHGHSPPEHISS